MPPLPSTFQHIQSLKHASPQLPLIQEVSVYQSGKSIRDLSTSTHISRRPRSVSAFDNGHKEREFVIPRLPPNIQSYLDKKELEAFFVPADGNCLYRAVTFGPEWSPHRLGRGITAAYLDALRQSGNDLAQVVDDAQVEQIRRGSMLEYLTNDRWTMGGYEYWAGSIKSIC
jgi:hypothetical protein